MLNTLHSMSKMTICRVQFITLAVLMAINIFRFLLATKRQLHPALQCPVSPADAYICTGHKFAAVDIGSLMISGYYYGLSFGAKFQFCWIH
jgi:hypothetical protein